jgi:predicted metal-dependent hydrolase
MSLLKAPWFGTSRHVSPGAFLISLETFDEPLPYTIKTHSRRVKISVEVSQGKVIVKSPPNCTEDMLHQFLTQQQFWLAKTLKKQLAAEPQYHFAREYIDGEPLYFLGESLTLRINPASDSFYTLNKQRNELQVFVSRRVKHQAKQIRKQLHDFYLEQAQQLIPQRLKALEQQTNLFSTALDFKFYQWRWGCCYASGKVVINPLLLAAPLEQIDCVIVHELCHLKHMNHGKEFWSLNASHCDACATTKRWLKQHHPKIYLPVVTPQH